MEINIDYAALGLSAREVETAELIYEKQDSALYRIKKDSGSAVLRVCSESARRTAIFGTCWVL